MIFAVAALLCVSAASVSAAHAHPNNRPDDTCNVCSTAHMAARDVAVIQLVHAPDVHGILPLPEAIQPQESDGFLSTLSRGPPSSL